MDNTNFENCRCWYCGKVLENGQYNQKVPMYQELSRSGMLETVRRVSYNQTEVIVPRCQRCAKSQKSTGILSNVVLAVLVIGAIIIIIGTEGKMWWLTVIIALALLVLYIFILNKVLDNNAKKKGTKTTLDGYPAIEDLKAKGWTTSKPQA